MIVHTHTTHTTKANSTVADLPLRPTTLTGKEEGYPRGMQGPTYRYHPLLVAHCLQQGLPEGEDQPDGKHICQEGQR